jgi:uncharacterized membrane protein
MILWTGLVLAGTLVSAIGILIVHQEWDAVGFIIGCGAVALLPVLLIYAVAQPFRVKD